MYTYNLVHSLFIADNFKNCNFKKGMEIKNRKNYANTFKLKIKSYGNKLKMDLNSYYRAEVNSKAFAIPCLLN